MGKKSLSQISPGQIGLDFNAPRQFSDSETKDPAVLTRDAQLKTESIFRSGIDTPRGKIGEFHGLLKKDNIERKGLHGQIAPLMRDLAEWQKEGVDEYKILDRLCTGSQNIFNFLKWGIRTKSAQFLLGVIKCNPNIRSVTASEPLIIAIMNRKWHTQEDFDAIGADIEALLATCGTERLDVNISLGQWSVLDLAKRLKIRLPAMNIDFAEYLRELGARSGGIER